MSVINLKGLEFSLKILGLGGAGVNVVNDMIQNDIPHVEYIVADTDLGKLGTSLADTKVQLGEKTTGGLGTGGDFTKGYLSAKEQDDTFKELLKNTDMLFLVCGMGGGTGSGAILRVAEIARKLEILTVSVVTKPFSFEGKIKSKNSLESINHLASLVDSYIIISNDNLLKLPDVNITLQNAFKEADNILKNSVQNVKNIIFENGLINLDFADIRSILRQSGEALIGFGRGRGDLKTIINNALSSPLIEGDLKGAKQLLINITSGSNFTLDKLLEVQNAINSILIIEPDNLLLGVTLDEELGDDIEVAIIGTKLKSS